MEINAEKIGKNLFIKLMNKKSVPKDAMNAKILDLAFTYNVVAEDEIIVISGKMMNEISEESGITVQRFHEIAMANTVRLMPPVFAPLQSFLDPPQKSSNSSLFVITNRQKTLGAATIFYPGMMEKIAEMVGSSYFVLPSSVHELIIVPDTGDYDYRFLEKTVSTINSDPVRISPDEKLSDNVYYFDRKAKAFDFARNFAK